MVSKMKGGHHLRHRIGSDRNGPSGGSLEHNILQGILYFDEAPLELQTTALGQSEVHENLAIHLDDVRLEHQSELVPIDRRNCDHSILTNFAGIAAQSLNGAHQSLDGVIPSRGHKEPRHPAHQALEIVLGGAAALRLIHLRGQQ